MNNLNFIHNPPKKSTDVHGSAFFFDASLLKTFTAYFNETIEGSIKFCEPYRRQFKALTRTYLNQPHPDDPDHTYNHSPAYLIDQFIEYGYQLIFDGPEYLTIADPTAPAERPFEFADWLRSFGINSKLDDQLLELSLYGSSYSLWHFSNDEPIIATIPVTNVLPDPSARSTRIPEWKFVAYYGSMVASDFVAGVKNKTYSLPNKGNLTPFEKDLQASCSTIEWFGYFYAPDRQLFHATAIAAPGASDTDHQICRILPIKSIPVFLSHYYQRPGPFGIGILARDASLSNQISTFTRQMIANTRTTAVAALKVHENSPAHACLKASGGLVPGLVIPTTPGVPGEVEALDVPRFPSSDIVQMLQFLSMEYEKRAGAPAADLQTFRTATAANLLERQTNRGPGTKIHRFAEQTLNPGFSRIYNYKYQAGSEAIGKVYVALTNQDHSRISRAAAIERFLMIMPQIQELLANTDTVVDVGALASEFLAALGIARGISHRKGNNIQQVSNDTPQWRLPKNPPKPTTDDNHYWRGLQSLSNPLAIKHS